MDWRTLDLAERQRVGYELVALGYAEVTGETDTGEPFFELTDDGREYLAGLGDLPSP